MSEYTPTRRELLRDGLLLAASATALAGCAPDEIIDEQMGTPGAADAGTDDAARSRPPAPTDLPESAAFPLGVATGDIDSRDGGRTIFWARHTQDTPLRLVVWDRASKAVVSDKPVEKADGGYVHADVGGLRPGALHEFVFTEIGSNGKAAARSPIGALRAPRADGDLAELAIGAYACTKQGRDFSTLSRGAERNLDAVLLLGDGSYCEGSRSLEQYRGKWSENLTTEAYRQIRGRSPYVSTWDDHDVDNNWDPEDIDPAWLAAATRAFFEHQPIRRQPAAADRIWRSVRMGATLEVFALDCRSERRSSKDQFISREQMEWLKSGLASSPCAFKFLLSSVPIGDFPWPFDFVSNYRWTGYPDQRDEILGFIDDKKIEGLCWLAGDFHLGSVGRVASSGRGAGQWEVLCGPGAQRGNPLYATMNEDQWPFTTGTSNITVFQLDPKTGRAVVQHVDGDGDVLNESTLFA